MITEGQYLDALKIVREYLIQIKSELIVEETDPIKLISLNDKLSVRTINGINHCYDRMHKVPEVYSLSGNSYKPQFDAKICGLLKLTKRELLKTRNFGMKGLLEIQGFLKEHGFELK